MASKPGKLPLPRKVARLERGNERGRNVLAAPSAAAQELIAAHLAEHGISPFRLEEHVHLGGSRSASQLISWDPGRATFHCQRCPGLVVWTGETTEAMVERALLFDQGVQPLLRGAGSDSERREIARAYLTGELASEQLRPWRKRRRRKPAAARPSVEYRRQRVQAWMLARYAELGVLARVIEDALRLWRDQPAEWEKVSDLAPVESTLRRYWQQIPDHQVAAAKAAFQAGERSRREVDLSR